MIVEEKDGIRLPLVNLSQALGVDKLKNTETMLKEMRKEWDDELEDKAALDTHAFLAFFNREEGFETIKNLMDAIQNGDKEGYVATITLTELAYIYTRKADAPSARLRVTQIQHSK